ncbi:hypothetical protein KJ966_02025 [bacterium]|nr:hypothetical protein [bacterium]
MRKRLIKILDYKERQWLFKAIFRMIISDKNVAKEEVDDLLESLKLVAGKEIVDITEISKSPEFLKPLKPLKGIDYHHAFIILTEVVRVAAIDSKIVLEEEELLKEILALLDFDETALTKVMEWARRLAIVNREENELKKELREDYQSH